MNTSLNTAATVNRSPSGCSQPVTALLTEDEREQLETLARQESRTKSATLRLFYLRGIAASGGGHPVNA
ncbi:hypothetical protein KUW18_16730 [Halomonas sp. DP5Y7-2]|uniref:hypothetical protein n=1 Tax=Halomonas sp. DP5Y7-2 TaxID=2859076 RepID=UPI001C99D01F|nr:hypothetical protein [Halomonas sp. DP5Y7-2]MBY5985740.1 hypothetical protein [Halomonas sp. DP5Y7-2]